MINTYIINNIIKRIHFSWKDFAAIIFLIIILFIPREISLFFSNHYPLYLAKMPAVISILYMDFSFIVHFHADNYFNII